MIEVFYESGSSGEIIRLDCEPYWMQTADILNYDWRYTEFNRHIKSFYKDISKQTFRISVLGTSSEGYSRNWNHLHEVFEKDVRTFQKGKLHFNGSYLYCYIIASQKDEWEYGIPCCDNTFTLLTDYPYWVTEVKKHCGVVNNEESGLAYPYGYPYGYYAHDSNVATFATNHFCPSEYELVIYGPAHNPAVFINGRQISVDCDLFAGEYLRINSHDYTVVKHGNTGGIDNLFDDRNKAESIFDPIPSINQITWDGTFAFDITAYLERSEPLWS